MAGILDHLGDVATTVIRDDDWCPLNVVRVRDGRGVDDERPGEVRSLDGPDQIVPLVETWGQDDGLSGPA
jgi:hypothetical protein